MNSKVGVIIVEDEPDLCDSLVEFLNLSGMEATGVNSGLEFYKAMARTSFDVAVLDVGLPDENGYVLAEYVRQNFAMGIIILTARGEAEERLKGYEAGADVYMVKPIDCRELVSAIRNLCCRLGGTTAKSPASENQTWQLNSGAWLLLSPKKEEIPLTSKEFKFLSILAKTPGDTIRRQQILTELGYGDDEYANRAMDSLVRRLRRKIEAGTNAQSPIKTAYTGGYCFSARVTTN